MWTCDAACPSGSLKLRTEIYYDPATGRAICYWLVGTSSCAKDAEKKCKANNGLLAYIPDQFAFDIVNEMRLDSGSYV